MSVKERIRRTPRSWKPVRFRPSATKGYDFPYLADGTYRHVGDRTVIVIRLRDQDGWQTLELEVPRLMTWAAHPPRVEVLRLLEQNRQFATWVISREETAVLIGLLRGEEPTMKSQSAMEWAEEWLAGKESLADMLERFAIHEIAVWRREHEPETHHDLTRPIWTPEEEK